MNNSPGNGIILSFAEFDIEASENCELDFLEVREDNGIGKLIGVYCGKEIATITSNSKLWLKFKSDGIGTSKGFRFTYAFKGGNELEGPIGRITSPMYPYLYKRTTTFSWRVTVDMDSIVRIEFRELHIENARVACINNIEVSILVGGLKDFIIMESP